MHATSTKCLSFSSYFIVEVCEDTWIVVGYLLKIRRKKVQKKNTLWYLFFQKLVLDLIKKKIQKWIKV